MPEFPCFMKSRMSVLWVTDYDHVLGHLYGTVIKSLAESPVLYPVGRYSKTWTYEVFSPCKETPELLKALALWKFNSHAS